MHTEKISFENTEGELLVGRLEFPIGKAPHNYVLFAHCFTCTKNLSAVKNISRALTAEGFAVLRFDFTGLGESEGDFADTNFSGNVEDLVAAANYLKKHHSAPSLIIGHSLGGAAVIFAASQIPSVQAVATIGAPSNPKHVKHLFKSSLEEITAKGIARVDLGGREFTIKKQFIEDLESKSLQETVKELRKSLLILHSPQDNTVSIKNAEEIYKAAHHPKSFVSLDGADHLLLSKVDSTYVGKVVSGWAQRYVPKENNTPLESKHDVVAGLDADAGFTTRMKVGNHQMIADEPKSFGGMDYGPSPYELVSAGLSACTAMTIQMYAKQKGWQVNSVRVHTSYSRSHAKDCENCEKHNAKIDTFHREIRFEGQLDQNQIDRLLQIADKCPVHKTLHNKAQVITKLLT
ncbi:OsmC-like protein [Croceitalea dokdonensis DOKDO 023]|uniref:OsmC-like protein n=1 Tax=Croceitalea dokdonensis DOKDO 023 TaxID=1300341 RepID=A0A0N8H4E3_9FLAO|nr:bifunctional alpha/beta hydrolase/OsmC family protein [Croceitalea dokdonensis]KPM33132.1 OsmC-like protein [Croceitalea dokdonensis DOKDO 023]